MTKATCKFCGKVVYLPEGREFYEVKEAVQILIKKLNNHGCLEFTQETGVDKNGK